MNQVVQINEGTGLPPKTGALAVGGSARAIIPQNLDDVYRLAGMIHASGMAPTSLKTKEAISVALMHGLEVGLPPMMALQSIAVINGRPTLWGDGALALVRATGLLESFDEWIDGAGENMIAYCKIKRRGEQPITHSFSISDARRAGLWSKAGPWQQYPRRMIAMRPRSWCLRDTFADVLKGLRIAEEVMDTPLDVKDISPPPVPSAPLTPPPAPPVDPVIIEAKQVAYHHPPMADEPPAELIISHEDRMADWKYRFASADRDLKGEIFEFEIEPYREAGNLSAEDYNSLLDCAGL